jgi:effector-binding domain-containing protein
MQNRLARVMSTSVTLTQVDPRPTAVIPQTTSWEQFPSLWPELLNEVYAFVRTCPDFGPTAGPALRWQNVMLYRDQRPAVEVGVLAPAPFTPAGRVIASTLPGGEVVRSVHRGDYSRLGDSHAAVHAYIREHGLEPAGPIWEIYGHWAPDPDRVETEIYHLLR